jgi:hypothetical protein
MIKNICEKHAVPLDGCRVEYYGGECPLCVAEQRIKQLSNAIANIEENIEDEYSD